MSGRNGIMSDNLKMEIARELGVYDKVQAEDGRSFLRNCGNLVKRQSKGPKEYQQPVVGDRTGFLPGGDHSPPFYRRLATAL
jgi:small acid-soluble spore protein F (minor alpha/beta-type SASP)